ncbi:MAG TPA: C39 family peptidase [Kofleriaceae bacterium]|nr:C39 family peptidase [Kofleriaceae bacterium]
MVRSQSIPTASIKIDLPNIVQAKDYTCGAAALLAICRYYGVGPRSERRVVEDMGFGRDGSDPKHVLRAVKKYGLAHEELRPMTIRQLRAYLDLARPVMLMLQAWADPRPASYRDHWEDGHWVVAIGHDTTRIYFEDPYLEGARGYLTHAQLDERWHDIEGRDAHHVDHYGLAIWKPALEARPIE